MATIKRTPLQVRGLVDEMVNQFCETKKENIDLKAENRRINRDRDLGSYYKKELEESRVLTDVYEDRILELRQERNKLKRELNRVTYNKIRTIAVILSIEDQNYYYKLYKGEMNKCPIEWKQYAELNKKDQKYWREYAYEYYRNYKWPLTDGKLFDD